MQVFIPTVKPLTDTQLRELGLEQKGEMALLRRRCQESEQSKYTVYRITFIVVHFAS